MKKQIRFLLTGLGIYAILLALLTSAESRAADATIRDFGDAVWFSLITMTTVGYGDLSPVTPAGRVLGAVFAFCSIGLLAALIGIGIRLISGELLPVLKLKRGKKQKWFAFREENPDSAALAKALREKEKDCLLIFPEGERLLEGPDVVRIAAVDTERLLRLRGRREGLMLFFMGEDPWENYAQARKSVELGAEACCMADVRPDRIPAGLRLFSPSEAMSRSYWKDYPLRKTEMCLVLVGSGESCGALLERALLTNVFESGRKVEYHVFGSAGNFPALHPAAVKALSGEGDADLLRFYGTDWAEARDLLLRADRIILCGEEDSENLNICGQLQKWFVTTGRIHVRLHEERADVCSFGEREKCLTPEFVLKDKIDRWAIRMNDIYNEGARAPTEWRDLSAFLRQSNIAAADHLIVKARYLLEREDLTELTERDCREAYMRYCSIRESRADELQEMEHRRWMRFYQMYNWEYDPERSDDSRHHPMMRAYEELSEEERRKDSYAWEMLGKI